MTPTSKEPTSGVGEEDFSAARDLSLAGRASDLATPGNGGAVNHYHHDAKVYEDLGRACEGNGLAWVGGDGEFRFQPPAEVIAEQARAELQRTFDLQWAADQRAIKRWQAAHPGNDLVWPDRANMVVWLMEQHAAMRELLAASKAMVAAEDALLAELRADGRLPDLTEKPWTLVDAMRAALAKATGRDHEERIAEGSDANVLNQNASSPTPAWLPVEGAPTGHDFLALGRHGDVRRCWRHKPSSRTDEILTFSTNAKFSATHWQPLPPPPSLIGEG